MPGFELACEKLNFSYGSKEILQSTRLHLGQGEHIWLRGRSGIGKTTFLKLLAGILPPVSGKVEWGKSDISVMTPKTRNEFRWKNIGYIEQDNRLIAHWTVNQILSTIPARKDNISQFYKRFGLREDLAHSRIENLSGGERQRVDLLRLVLSPKPVALIDEPTSHLDDQSAQIILRELKTSLAESTVIIVSHDRRLEDLKFKQLNFDELSK